MVHPTNPQPDDFFYGDGDIEQAELEEAGREAGRRLRQAKLLIDQANDADRAGKFVRRAELRWAAAHACPHTWGRDFPNDAPSDDPRRAERGTRCYHCGSWLSEDRDGLGDVNVLHPCELPPVPER